MPYRRSKKVTGKKSVKIPEKIKKAGKIMKVMEKGLKGTFKKIKKI